MTIIKSSSYSLFVIVLLLEIFLVPGYLYSSTDLTEQQKKEAADKALKDALTLGYPDISLIHLLLRERNFENLEKYLSKLEVDYKEDPKFESRLIKGYESFNSDSKKLLTHLNAWVDERRSYTALCARGTYYSNLGWNVRGDKYIEDTAKISITRMQHFHNMAKEDLKKSLEINPSFMPAYSQLLSISRGAGNYEDSEKLITAALRHDNRTYYVRAQYLISLLPRWGGSYPQMAQFISESIPYAPQNPRIWSIQGEIDYDKARLYSNNKNYVLAIYHHSKALSFGDRVQWLKNRAYCYAKIQQYDKELKDRERVLYYFPIDTDQKMRVEKLKRYLNQR